MRNNEIRVSNTPIFDQLARERGYERMVASDLEAVRFAEFRRPMARLQASQDRLVASVLKVPAAFFTKRQTDENVNAASTESETVQSEETHEENTAAVVLVTSIGEDEPDSMYVKPQFWNVDDQE